MYPDDAFLNLKTKKLYIIEKKYQEGSGSVDEKLQTFAFKIREYKHLLSDWGIEVKFIYVLSDFFKNDKYKDVFEYMDENNCKHFINEIPIDELDI